MYEVTLSVVNVLENGGTVEDRKTVRYDGPRRDKEVAWVIEASLWGGRKLPNCWKIDFPHGVVGSVTY